MHYREEVARRKAPAFRTETYWGRPVPGFGDPYAWLFIVGLAPAAHGANRTGRMFTGDGPQGLGTSSWPHYTARGFSIYPIPVPLNTAFPCEVRF